MLFDFKKFRLLNANVLYLYAYIFSTHVVVILNVFRACQSKHEDKRLKKDKQTKNVLYKTFEENKRDKENSFKKQYEGDSEC